MNFELLERWLKSALQNTMRGNRRKSNLNGSKSKGKGRRVADRQPIEPGKTIPERRQEESPVSDAYELEDDRYKEAMSQAAEAGRRRK
jgi:hypothetical protein